MDVPNRMSRVQAEAAGFMVDTSTYPWFGYKGERCAYTESTLVLTDLEAFLLSRAKPPVRRELDFSNVPPDKHDMVTVWKSGPVTTCSVWVDYGTGETRLCDKLHPLANAQPDGVIAQYIECSNGFDVQTRYKLKRRSGSAMFDFVRSRDLKRFQRAYDWVMQLHQPDDKPVTRAVSTVRGELVVRGPDLSESCAEALLDLTSREVSLVRSSDEEPLPDGPYEWQAFYFVHAGKEERCSVFVDENGGRYVEQHLVDRVAAAMQVVLL